MEQQTTDIAIVEFAPIVKQSGLEKAEQYAAIFSPFMVTLKQLSDKATVVNHDNPTAIDAKIAREVRLALVKNRTATGTKKDESKSTLMAEANLIQNLHNVVVNSSKLIEADLEEVEKFAENKEKERKAALAIERAAMFEPYRTDLTGYDLGTMADNVFSDLLESQKLLHEKRIADAARIEAERIEAERSELERQAALKAENERLKKEAEAAAAELKASQEAAAKAQAELKAKKNEADRIDRERISAEKKAAKAPAELKAKKDEADRIDRERISAEKKAAKAPVKEKLKTAVTSLVLELPESEITVDILAKFSEFKTWALQQIETL